MLMRNSELLIPLLYRANQSGSVFSEFGAPLRIIALPYPTVPPIPLTPTHA